MEFNKINESQSFVSVFVGLKITKKSAMEMASDGIVERHGRTYRVSDQWSRSHAGSSMTGTSRRDSQI